MPHMNPATDGLPIPLSLPYARDHLLNRYLINKPAHNEHFFSTTTVKHQFQQDIMTKQIVSINQKLTIPNA